jgi:predicted dehydrogenase
MSCERRLRLGIIGTAKIADKICWAVEQSFNCAVVAVASRTPERARRWADERGIMLSYGSYGELIASQEVDAVYIALPCAMHAQWTTQAAAHGLHILCEKPLAASAAEADAMLESCRRAGVLLMDGQMWPHHFRTEAMLGALTGLGSVRRAACCLCFNAPDEFFCSNIRADASLEPLGCLGDLGWYCAAALDAVLAPNGELPVRVCCHIEWSGGGGRGGGDSGEGGEGGSGGDGGESACASASPSPCAPSGVPVAAHALLVYASGASGSFHCGFDAARRDYLEVQAATSAPLPLILLGAPAYLPFRPPCISGCTDPLPLGIARRSRPPSPRCTTRCFCNEDAAV